MQIYGNVVKATHGESSQQVLGSGDATTGLQRFVLRGSPLTHVSAPIPAGATPELEVRVNGVRWDRHDNLVELGPNDRGYVIRTDDDAVTSIVLGDGVHGARPPSGAENVNAAYRLGLGLGGNVPARAIDTLIDRPLGVKEVINPIEASGGADRESRDRARANAPLAVRSLDRLVAVRDYADFARTFAGIDKADARLLPIGRRRTLHLTVALAGDGPLDRNGDLYRNLRRALADFGDPSLAIRIDGRAVRLVILSARVRIAADEQWEHVEPRIRDALVAALGFDARDLGRGLALSEVVAVIDGVRGVDYVDVDLLDWVDEERLLDIGDDRGSNGFTAFTGPRLSAVATVIAARPARVDPKTGAVVPADLVYADPTIRGTVVLQELPR